MCEKGLDMPESVHVKRSRITNDALFHEIEQEPGLSKYKLTKKLNWSMGKTDGAINRLLDSGRIFIKEIERDGRKVKLVYPKTMIPNNNIRIPKSELEISNSLWSTEAHFFGLDSDTIGITGEEYAPWKHSRYRQKAMVKDDGDDISISFPTEFQAFYNLPTKHFSISVNSNRVILTINGYLIV